MSDMTLDEFWSILHSVAESNPISYRLYYNDNGEPIIYSMEDMPHNYIEVDPEVYAIASFSVRVVAGKLVHVKPKITVKKLQPSTLEGTACSPYDVCIVVDVGQEHTKWKIVNNEIR